MTRSAEPVLLSEEQVLHFRDLRSHLVGPGAASAAEAARAILGAQAQQEGPGLLALSLRTRGRPTASSLKRELVGEPRRLVRTWGQRDTVHVFDPDDWPLVVAARGEWPRSGRRGAVPREPDLDLTRRFFEEAEGPVFRRELFEIIPKSFLAEVAAHPGVTANGLAPNRFAASRLIWRLALAGDICFAEKQGSEQSYVHRGLWFPELAWGSRETTEDAAGAATLLARRYLGVHGPATPADMAHFFGARVGSARTWLERLESETVEVRCGSREGLIALAEDLPELQQTVPKRIGAWPVRFLPKWDTHLMRHSDKSWIMPVEEERPLVWRKGGDISASVVARGRIVATWSYRATKKRVVVKVSPLSRWRKAHLAGVRREAAALAAFFELPDFGLEIEN